MSGNSDPREIKKQIRSIQEEVETIQFKIRY